MSVGFFVEELAKVFGVDEVTVDAHRDTEWRINVEWLSFRAGIVTLVSGAQSYTSDNTYAEAVPMVG